MMSSELGTQAHLGGPKVVVVGGGLAGLIAAYRLRDRGVVLLEAEDRVGGRIHSTAAGRYWLNFGAHMFGGPGSTVGDLVNELGLRSEPIRGRLLGMSMDGIRLLTSRLEAFPLLLPLALPARISFARMGLMLRLGGARAVRAMAARPGETVEETTRRLGVFENHRTLARYVGRLHPEIAAILTAITERTGADPAEMAAGYALRSFTNVWSAHSPGRNLIGGSAGLPQALATALGSNVRRGADVTRVTDSGTGVEVEYRSRVGTERILADLCIVAVPAFVARRIVEGLEPGKAAALDHVRYGPFLTMAIHTSERQAMAWDGNYAVSTPHRRFSVLFNQSTTLRDGPRQPGGSLMLFRGARGAADMMQMDDAAIRQAWLSDLAAEFPESSGLVQDAVVQRWEHGAPYSFPGRAALQEALERPQGRIAFAGDYLDFPNMEAAVTMGTRAADWALSRTVSR